VHYWLLGTEHPEYAGSGYSHATDAVDDFLRAVHRTPARF